MYEFTRMGTVLGFIIGTILSFSYESYNLYKCSVRWFPDYTPILLLLFPTFLLTIIFYLIEKYKVGEIFA